MRFNAASDPVAVPAIPTLDLRRFPVVTKTASASWFHDVRSLDANHRVVVTELALTSTTRIGDGCVVASINGSAWILRRERGVTVDAIAVDRRGRVTVPCGVRHLLGLGRIIGVSVSADRMRVALWPVQLLDSLAEGGR